MDLQPLAHSGDVSPEQFRALFAQRMGSLFSRGLAVLQALGPVSSFKVANVFHLAIQKDVLESALIDLERWVELYTSVPRSAQVDADTWRYIEALYAKYFVDDHPQRSAAGSSSPALQRFGTYSLSGGGLWTPAQARY